MTHKNSTYDKLKTACAKLDKRGVQCVTVYDFAKVVGVTPPTARAILHEWAKLRYFTDVYKDYEQCLTVIEIAHRPKVSKRQYCLGEGLTWDSLYSIAYEIPF